jgi:thiol-disulfide isomerase/thioredoxin
MLSRMNLCVVVTLCLTWSFRGESLSVLPLRPSFVGTTTTLYNSLGSSITPEHHDKEKKGKQNDNEDDEDDWTPIKGGFIPNFLRKKVRPKQNVLLVDSLMDYKTVVVDEPEKLVVVRFFATWCKSCRASEPHFMKLVSKFSPEGVKFVEVPLTKDTAFMIEGLSVPSVPFAHIYHPEAGLVEEMRASKKHTSKLHEKLLSYVIGSCDLPPEEEEERITTDATLDSSNFE